MSKEDDDSDTDGNSLPPAQNPEADASHILSDTYKDHDNVLHAVLWEFGQNAIDALLWGVQEQNRDNDECDIHFRVNSEENTVEMWDQAVGMNPTKMQEHYLSIGVPGDEKFHKDTGGSQGKGFWAICGWSNGAYIETMDQDGDRWCARAYPHRLQDNISEIIPVSESELQLSGRPELERPGVYLRLEGITDDDMRYLTNHELAIENIERKFSFALSNPRVNVSFTYEIDGEVYEPSTYDFKEIAEQAEVSHDNSLDEFHLKGENRQLKNLKLIKTADLPDDFEPPWTGVAMLKGGEYTDNIPYMNVWAYTPQHAERVRNGELWGWVDASELCPKAEEHGHTGFLNSSRIYDESGLKDRILEVVDEEFESETVRDDTKATEEAHEVLLNGLDEFDDIDTSGGSGGGGGGPLPDDPKIHASTDGYYFEESDNVPLYLLVTNPNDSGITEFHISGELQRVIDEDGDEIPEDERDDPLRFDDAGSIPLGVERHKISETPPQYSPPRAGGYQIRLEMKDKPDVKGEEGDIGYQIALDQKPVRDETKHTFYVGDVESPNSDSVGTTGPDFTNPEFETIGLINKPEKTYRARITPAADSDGKCVEVNEAHPEYKKLIDAFDGHGTEGVKGDIIGQWGFLRVFMNRTSEQINEMLDEKGVSNSEIRVNVENIVKERLDGYDAFCHKHHNDAET